jgi:DNA polymerase elongation subunit (family B)
MSSNKSDIIFHLLDLQSRDVRVEAEHDDVREVVYESVSEDEDDDEEFQKKRRGKRSSTSAPAVTRQYTIHLFGSTEDGTPLRCDVSGFRPSFYLRLPEQERLIPTAIESIRKYIEKQRIPIKELEFKRVMKHVFYGFTAKRFYPFLEISFPSLSLFRNTQNLFLDEFKNFSTKYPLDPPLRGTTVEVFESNIDPMLRFLHTQNIQPCGWICIKDGASSIVEESKEGLVIECDYEQILPTKGPRVSAPFLTASWDIECCSYTGDFPLAKRTWLKTARELADHLHQHSELNATDLYQRVVMAVCEGDRPTETVPKGMTPVYGTWKTSMDAVMKHVTAVKTGKELDGILEKGVDTYDELVECLEKCLTRVFGSILQLNGDPVIQIGTTLTRGTVESTERHLFVFPDCALISGIEVHAYPTEKSMIEAWFEWMVQRNPDILIGYNVFGFDEAYLWHRAEELGVVTPTSLLHAMTRLFDLGSELKLEEKFLSSSAMGDNRMYIWNTHGRLQIDMFHYIKRGYTLPSYKLDEVTKHFMSGKLKSYEYDEKAEELVLKVAGAVKDMKVGRSITLLDETGETVTPKLMVLSVEKDVLRVQWKWDEEVWAEIADATKWVVVKDDVGPQDIFRLHRESAEGRAIVGKYCLQDCDLVIDLYKKLETFNNSMSMANVCSVPVSYIFTRGQGIKIESLIFKFCREKDVLIPVLANPSKSGEGETYEGAIVLDPEPGFYSTSPIGVCDFASLYPSTIVSENISHDSLLWVKDFTYDGEWIADQWGSEAFDEHPGFAYTDIEFDIIRPDPNDRRKTPNKIKCGRRVCRFAKPLDGTKSTLPQITTWLLNARSAKKKEMKAEKDPERYALLDSEQLAYKLTGNSLYGQLGSGTFKIRLQALAASVTAYGRKQILFAKAAIEKFYGPDVGLPNCSARVVYGDTDSLFVQFNVKNPETGELLSGREARQATIDITDEAGHFITKALAPPHDFEFDKAFDPLLMFSKKRYAGNMYEENADDYVHKYMGIALKRRDNAPIVKTIYGGAMKMLLNSRDVEGAYRFVRDKCVELVKGEVSMGQLTVTKSLRDHYADPTRIAHKALADRIALRDPGNAPAAGDRIGYVYICPKGGQEASKLQGDRIEIPSFIKENQLTPDYRHYIEHQLMNPISQAFALLLEQIPGFDPTMLKGCPLAKENLDGYLVFREKIAADLLFTDALKCYDRIHRNQSLTTMFGKQLTITTKTKETNGKGGNVTTVTTTTTTTAVMTATSATNGGGKKQTLLSSFTTPLKQTTMSSYFMDEMIVKSLNKRKQATKKKEKEKESEKAEAEAEVENKEAEKVEKGKKRMSK